MFQGSPLSHSNSSFSLITLTIPSAFPVASPFQLCLGIRSVLSPCLTLRRRPPQVGLSLSVPKHRRGVSRPCRSFLHHFPLKQIWSFSVEKVKFPVPSSSHQKEKEKDFIKTKFEHKSWSQRELKLKRLYTNERNTKSRQNLNCEWFRGDHV